MPDVARVIAWLLLCLAIGAPIARAQESGGSFGGSAWDETPSGGGGSGSVRSRPSGGGRIASEREREHRREQEAQRREEERRRQREEAEEARRRQEADERAAAAREAASRAEHDRLVALPEAERVAALSWPPSPSFPSIASPRVVPLSTPLPRAPREQTRWPGPSEPVQGAPTAVLAGPPAYDLGAVAGLATFVPLAVALFGVELRRRRRGMRDRSAGFAHGSARTPTAGSAMRLSIAFDWTARATLQAGLAEMAGKHDLGSRTGLSDAAATVSSLLAPHARAARYVTWELSTGDPRAWLQTRANDLRARFRTELVRNDTKRGAPELRAGEHEGKGLVVVSILVAGKDPIAPPAAAFEPDAVAEAIACISKRSFGQTLALEVIWSPAAENDRMSSYELEKRYPELQRISAGVGARGCLYCRGPFPAELDRCPNCGAPTASR